MAPRWRIRRQRTARADRSVWDTKWRPLTGPGPGKGERGRKASRVTTCSMGFLALGTDLGLKAVLQENKGDNGRVHGPHPKVGNDRQGDEGDEGDEERC